MHKSIAVCTTLFGVAPASVLIIYGANKIINATQQAQGIVNNVSFINTTGTCIYDVQTMQRRVQIFVNAIDKTSCQIKLIGQAISYCTSVNVKPPQRYLGESCRDRTFAGIMMINAGGAWAILAFLFCCCIPYAMSRYSQRAHRIEPMIHHHTPTLEHPQSTQKPPIRIIIADTNASCTQAQYVLGTSDKTCDENKTQQSIPPPVLVINP